MTLRPVEQRAYDAFADGDAEKANKYLDTVMTSWKEVSVITGRVTLFILILAAVFEFLVIPASISTISIGPLAVRNSSLVQEFIPILIAYLLYYQTSLSTNWAYHQYIYEAILYRFQPKLARSLLTMTVQPKVLGPWTTFGPGNGLMSLLLPDLKSLIISQRSLPSTLAYFFFFFSLSLFL